ncbi:hypothetical protein D3C87_1515050 [compost metagenome]
MISILAIGLPLRIHNDDLDSNSLVKTIIVILIYMTSTLMIVANRMPIMKSALKSKKVAYIISVCSLLVVGAVLVMQVFGIGV